ncbi:MAG: LPS export ABC transporter periplasmic protein LptC [Alphaproteobacteria bacterium]
MTNKHNHFVKIIKIACGTIIALALLLLLITINTGTPNNIKLKNNKDKNAKNHPSTIINNPTFFGCNKDNNNYTLTSEQTTQISEYIYKFNKIQGKYYLDQDHKEYIAIAATEAIANSNLKDIELINDVEIVFSEGYRMLTEKLNLNFNLKQAITSQIVTITGIKGKIIAYNGLQLKDKEKTIEFYGPVKTILY